MQQEERRLIIDQKPGSVTTNIFKVDFTGSLINIHPIPHFFSL